MRVNNKNQIDEELPSDNPPPYTPHPNQSSSSSAPLPPSSPSPPDYDETMHEKRKQPLHQRRSFQGSLGSVFEMVNNVAPASRTTINTLSATAAEATKMALNMVDDIMSETFDSKEERVRRRATRKEQRREERERMAQQFEHLASAFSGFKPRPYSQCGSSSTSPNFEHRPWQPTPVLGGCSKSKSNSSCSSRSGNSNNTRKLEMKHSHGPLIHDGNWSGDECRLKTSNGILTVNGSLEAKDSISLEANNGSIVVNGSITSKKYIDIKSTNGTLYIQRQLTARELLVNMQNGPININVPIQADRIDIRTKNAPITLTQVFVSKELVVKTTNAPIVMHVVDILKDAEIRVESTNAPVTVYLPKTFSGRFYIASSSNSSANITPINGNSRLVLEKDEHYKKDGKCLHMDDKPNKTLNVKTTNAPAVVYV